jgi:hypothetical protein
VNVEELREIAESLLAHARDTGVVASLEQLKQAVQQQVSNPQDPSVQSSVADSRNQLAESLRSGEADEFNARWRRLVTEMGIGILLPDDSLRRLEDLFLQNQVTPQVVNEGVSEMSEQISSAVSQLTSLVEALASLNLESSGLRPGEFEAAVVIPRAAVDNSLTGLGRELQELEELMRPFVESDVGSPPPLEVRQIASSDFLAAVLLTPGAAVLLSKAIDGVLAVYERVLRIRKLRQELREAGLTEETIENVEQDATELVDREIPSIVREAMEGASTLTTDSRRHEIEIALTHSVRGIARRVDHGFRMTVRAGPLPEADEDEDGGTSPDDFVAQVAAARDLVIENQRRADTQELAGDPILRELGLGNDRDPSGLDPDET